ncbi:hypothetical protein MMC30_008283 [Trapelia coarctata]|nr:hypothetical protein [Trapelia coarctata]
MRILIKDNIHLKGVKTSVGNRAFYDTYPPRPEPAECVQKLIDQGAVILGKTKMNSLATWEEPVEYIDYQAPWNSRADAYQSPGGSSSGSAAAIAMYDWLDIAIGTDTWGSVTRPALWCGCCGLRPSFGAVSAHGIEPCCQTFDTAGILGRDLQKCRSFAAEWLLPSALQNDPKPFTLTIWPLDFWKVIDSEQVSIARRFTQQVVSHLKADYKEVLFEELWLKSPPEGANGCSLSEFIDWAADIQDYDAYHNCDDFRDKYSRLTGHAPYVSPPNQKAWKFAQTISKEIRDSGFKRMEVYQKWFEDTILAATDGNVLIVMPLESLTPRYRDEVPSFERPPPGINTLALAAVLNAPAVTSPIAEIPFHSRITEREEKLPFAVAIMGTDLALMDTICDVLKAVGLPTTVKTGRRMFE